MLLGRTRNARATIRVLVINHPDFVAFRTELMEEGVFCMKASDMREVLILAIWFLTFAERDCGDQVLESHRALFLSYRCGIARLDPHSSARKKTEELSRQLGYRERLQA